MANLNELTRYKEKLMEQLCTTQSIVDLMTIDGDGTIDGKSLRYKRIYPYAYVPETAQKAQPYICFEVEVLSVSDSGMIQNASIWVWMFTAQALMNPTGKRFRGIWHDAIAAEVDKILNGSENYGHLARVKLVQSLRSNPITGYHGRVNQYVTRDLTRLCEDLL